MPCHEVEEWISSDEIAISAEEDVFKIILRWIDHKKSERIVKFRKLFRHIRLTCVSRDFLMSDVVTNNLVKENEDCLDSVTGSLAWIDHSTDCDVPRPHRPRKALETCVIAVCSMEEPFRTLSYVPYSFPERAETVSEPELVFSCRCKLCVICQNTDRAQCYDPVLKNWSPAPWTKQRDTKLELISGDPVITYSSVLVVENEICFIVTTFKPFSS